MNKKTNITALFALVTMAGQAQLESVKELSIKSEYFNHERQVLIYTPAGYQQYDQTYYDDDVIAMNRKQFQIGRKERKNQQFSKKSRKRLIFAFYSYLCSRFDKKIV